MIPAQVKHSMMIAADMLTTLESRMADWSLALTVTGEYSAGCDYLASRVRRVRDDLEEFMEDDRRERLGR